MAPRPLIPNARARALFLRRHGVAGAPSGPGGNGARGGGRGADLAEVIDGLGSVQLDSVTTVARAHHMILHARRTAYRPGALTRLHERDRALFEHWTHDASLIPARFFPHWRLKFRRYADPAQTRWRTGTAGTSGAAGEKDFGAVLDAVRRRIADHGPCSSSDVGADEARSPGGWWDWHPSKAALEHLWRVGEIAVARREGFRKVYDLTERVIPPEHLNVRVAEADTVAWACGAALDRLGFATPGELAAFWDLVAPGEAQAWAARALATGAAVEADVEGADGRLRRSLVRPATLEEPAPTVPSRLRVLSPFDPALRDRARAERLWGFRYRIEIFVPAAKRRYGYYVFPLLDGDRLAGRIDMRTDRDRDALHVRAMWPEAGVRFGPARTRRLEAALARTARLAGVGAVTFAQGWRR